MGVRKPVVAIVGRQNVGKSTLFNALVGKFVAIVEDLPGTTRDRILGDVSWNDTTFTLVDTGGLITDPKTAIALGVNEQVEVAIAEADLILFIVDAKQGLTPSDQEVAARLRQTSKPLLVVANKADNLKFEQQAVEFHALGIGEPVTLSAYHRAGLSDLLDMIVARLPAPEPLPEEPGVMKIAIVGRPNVGKSTLLNTLIGEKRALVDETPGTTRDAIDTRLTIDGQEVLLIDTAGIRRRGQVGMGVEKYSVIRALDAIERADIALLVLDATELLAAQDMHVAGYIQQAMKGIILVVNKWDMAADRNIEAANQYVRSRLKFMPYAPIIYTSALRGEGVNRVMAEARRVYAERMKRIPTAEVNRTIQEATAAHNMPRRGGKQLKIYYATQADINPPTFVFSVNAPELVHFTYRRYIENRLRETFGFDGTPLRMIFKPRSEHDNR